MIPIDRLVLMLSPLECDEQETFDAASVMRDLRIAKAVIIASDITQCAPFSAEAVAAVAALIHAKRMTGT